METGMLSDQATSVAPMKKPIRLLFILLIIVGFGTFAFGIMGHHPERAWQTYLINFLLWSAIAQGALVFSVVMHITKARWSGPLNGVAEAFVAFFPISFVLFLALYFGKSYIFPWLHYDLHGKAVWLNLPFLFSRDFFGLLILYLLGFGYVYYALQLKFDPEHPQGGIRKFVSKRWKHKRRNEKQIKDKMTIWGTLYILAFAFVLSLIGYDLIMSMEPYWISTLFGGYIFIKAFYIGLGGMIILATVLHLRLGEHSNFLPSHFHDLGKLFFAFCLVWADFFYAQLVVIWYGNISEETHYVIQRTVFLPWKPLAWTVFIVCFIMPFIILLNRKIKTKPVLMMILSAVVIVGIWFEHLLLLGPAFNPNADAIPLNIADGLISLGFLGLMTVAVRSFLNIFPEITRAENVLQRP
jgi:hypothetical protein